MACFLIGNNSTEIIKILKKLRKPTEINGRPFSWNSRTSACYLGSSFWRSRSDLYFYRMSPSRCLGILRSPRQSNSLFFPSPLDLVWMIIGIVVWHRSCCIPVFSSSQGRQCTYRQRNRQALASTELNRMDYVLRGSARIRISTGFLKAIFHV